MHTDGHEPRNSFNESCIDSYPRNLSSAKLKCYTVCTQAGVQYLLILNQSADRAAVSLLALCNTNSHYFHSFGQYAEQLMDLAERRPMFAGRGQKPLNKEV